MLDIKTLKPLGVIIILFCAVAAIVMCFTTDFGIPERYESLHDTEYYAQNRQTMEELEQELSENVFPNLEGIVSHHVSEATNKLEVTISKAQFKKMTAVILRDFDESLFVFLEES